MLWYHMILCNLSLSLSLVVSLFLYRVLSYMLDCGDASLCNAALKVMAMMSTTTTTPFPCLLLRFCTAPSMPLFQSESW